MKTDVIITAGHRRGRRGYLYGAPYQVHPVASKTLVMIGKETVALAFGDFVPVEKPPQLELPLS